MKERDFLPQLMALSKLIKKFLSEISPEAVKNTKKKNFQGKILRNR